MFAITTLQNCFTQHNKMGRRQVCYAIRFVVTLPMIQLVPIDKCIGDIFQYNSLFSAIFWLITTNLRDHITYEDVRLVHFTSYLNAPL